MRRAAARLLSQPLPPPVPRPDRSGSPGVCMYSYQRWARPFPGDGDSTDGSGKLIHPISRRRSPTAACVSDIPPPSRRAGCTEIAGIPFVVPLVHYHYTISSCLEQLSLKHTRLTYCAYCVVSVCSRLFTLECHLKLECHLNDVVNVQRCGPAHCISGFGHVRGIQCPQSTPTRYMRIAVCVMQRIGQQPAVKASSI